MRDTVVVLDNVRSAYNVGSILRTSDSAGAKSVYLCGITAPADNSKVKKTALGAENYVATKYFGEYRDYRDTLEALAELKSRGYRIIGVEQSESSVNPFATHFKENIDGTSKIALIMGNEVDGIHPEVLSECDMVLELPMVGQKESLNVCVAMGIIIYHFNFSLACHQTSGAKCPA